MHAQYQPLMGRKRTHDFNLPPRMYRRGVRYYYVTHDKRWLPLGADLDRARRLWADYECLAAENTVEDLLTRYMADCMPAISANTRKQYGKFAKRLIAKWGDCLVESLRTPEIAQWRDLGGVGKVAANGMISLLRGAYDKAIEWGWAEINPAEKVSLNPTNVRLRYLTDEEFRAIRTKAPHWLALAMDIAYLTALRPIDVLTLRWENVLENGKLRVRPTKTRRSNMHVEFEITPALRSVLEAARRRPILGLYIIANEKGRPIAQATQQRVWREIRDELKFEDCHFRDIRAKAGTDAEEQGHDYQALLTHTTKRMSDRYLKKGKTVHATALARKV